MKKPVHNFKDLTGQKFGKLTIISRCEETKHGQAMWLCKCDCGGEKITYGHCIRSGETQSCGCLNGKHHMRHTRQYQTWATMKKRCLNPNCEKYKSYGGRGIKICDKWLTFEGFWEDMKEGYTDNLTIDRIDVNGDYCKENCRWATTTQQANNKQSSRYIEYNGEVKTMSEWCKEYNLNIETFRDRIDRGWDIGKALTTPPRKIRRTHF